MSDVTTLGWGHDMATTDGIALESFHERFEQSNNNPNAPAYFKPVNISVERGIHYVTMYACVVTGNETKLQQLLMWFGSLKETDYVKLTVLSLVLDIPANLHLPLLAAIVRCKATIEIQLNSLVGDTLAYYYLATPHVKTGAGGALFVPSYVDSRQEDKSTPWMAVHDFFSLLVQDALSRALIKEDEAHRLNNGQHVIIPLDRFNP